MRAYIDSDVLIWHLRGERRAAELLRRVRSDPAYDLWTGALQRAEVVFFMRPEEESGTLLLLSQLGIAVVTQEIVDRGGVLYRRYNPSHGMDVNDALLAATAMATGGRIYTLNTRHYPGGEIPVEQAW